jgi:hypothetical protein
MRILKLLNKKIFSIFLVFFLFFSSISYSEEEAVDIWNLNSNTNIKENEDLNSNESIDDEEVPTENSIYKMNSEKENNLEIQEEEKLLSKKIEVTGLYDPEENGLNIDMWSYSDGDLILNIFKNINKIKLSKDAEEILNIALLTNSYFPKNDISYEEFLKIKSDWLIKNANLKLIEDYIIKNENLIQQEILIKFIVDEYLSMSELEKSCNLFLKINQIINDDYLSKFNIYCLINAEKKEEAQLLFDLKKELGLEDIFLKKN